MKVICIPLQLSGHWNYKLAEKKIGMTWLLTEKNEILEGLFFRWKKYLSSITVFYFYLFFYKWFPYSDTFSKIRWHHWVFLLPMLFQLFFMLSGPHSKLKGLFAVSVVVVITLLLCMCNCLVRVVPGDISVSALFGIHSECHFHLHSYARPLFPWASQNPIYQRVPLQGHTEAGLAEEDIKDSWSVMYDDN